MCYVAMEISAGRHAGGMGDLVETVHAYYSRIGDDAIAIVIIVICTHLVINNRAL